LSQILVAEPCGVATVVHASEWVVPVKFLLREYQDQVIGRSILDVSVIGEKFLAFKYVILESAGMNQVDLAVLYSSVHTTERVVDEAVLGKANGLKNRSFNELFLRKATKHTIVFIV